MNQANPLVDPVSQSGSVELMPGSLFVGTYRIRGCIGGGGMGSVFEVVHENLDKRMALKVLVARRPDGHEFLRIQKEARALARFDHKNIVRVFDVGVEGNVAYFSMEYLEGESLAQLLQKQGTIDPCLAFDIFSQLMEALEYAHGRGVVHRDIKPANIMIVWQEGGTPLVKVVDFGIARYAKGEGSISLTRTGEVLGSPVYMSPEQAVGQRVDRRSDLYSSGLVLYEMLTGEKIFEGDSALLTIGKHICEDAAPILARQFDRNPAIARLIGILLNKDKDDRYGSASAVLEDMRVLGLWPFDEGFLDSLDGAEGDGSDEGANDQNQKRRRAFERSHRQALLRSVGALAEGRGLSLINSIDTPQWVLLLGFFALLCVVSVSVILFTVGGYGLKQPGLYEGYKAEKLLPSSYDDGQREKTQALSEYLTATTPFSHKERRGGRNFRVFHFDEKISVGTIITEGKEYDARGTLVFPYVQWLEYRPSGNIAQFPQLLDRFAADDFCHVSLDHNFSVTTETVRHLAHMKSIMVLNLEATDVRNDVVEVFDQLPLLSALHIGDTRLEPEAIAKWKGLHNLRVFKLSGDLECRRVLDMLAPCKGLEILGLGAIVVHRADIQRLAAFPKLFSLRFTAVDLNRDDMTSLAKMPKLRFLTIYEQEFGPEYAASLVEFPRLEAFEGRMNNWPSSYAKMLKKIRPRLTLRRQTMTDFELGVPLSSFVGN